MSMMRAEISLYLIHQFTIQYSYIAEIEFYKMLSYSRQDERAGRV